MVDKFIPVKDLEWKSVKIHRQGESLNYDYELELFCPLADWDVWDYWERERIDSMKEHIKDTDVLWEIGTEQGWMAALFSKYITPNLVLIEPTAEFWPGIKAMFEKNGLEPPIVSFVGFADDRSESWEQTGGWPIEAEDDQVIEKRKYRNFHDKDDRKIIKGIRLDNIAAICDAISIDVEGAELHVLRGAEHILREHKPKVWVSVHPDMMERDYKQTKEDLLFFMDDCGYKAELLAVDHEEHYIFVPKEV